MLLDLHVGDLTEPITGRKWDRHQIKHQVHLRMAYYKSQGMRKLDRVFIHYGNNLEFFVDLIAIWTLGGCVIPIDTRFSKFEVETLAKTAEPRFSLWCGEADQSISASLSDTNVKILENLEALEKKIPSKGESIIGNEMSLDQAALILFTSGTTGRPKGVVHTHRSLRARWISLRHALGISSFRRTICLLPTHFGHGLICNCLFPWLSGQTLFVVPPFKPEIVMNLGRLLDEQEITFMSSVPSIWRLVLKMTKPPQSRKLERVFCGSAPLSEFLWKEIQEWTGTKEVFNAYGITETGSWVAGSTVPNLEPKDGLIGEPWGAVVKILKSSTTKMPPYLIEECCPGEPGYVWINTPALMQGYFKRDDLTNEVVTQGWFMTGDIGFIDDRGWLYLRGREREEINKGGMKVYPGDIDAVIEQFKGVEDVCCFGYEGDPLYGENVGVAIVMKDKTHHGISALYDWVKYHLAKYQMPLRWYFVETIPRTSRGKLNRAKVAEECSRLIPLDLSGF